MTVVGSKVIAQPDQNSAQNLGAIIRFGICKVKVKQCGTGDLNPQALRHMYLKHARLPIPPDPQISFNFSL